MLILKLKQNKLLQVLLSQMLLVACPKYDSYCFSSSILYLSQICLSDDINIYSKTHEAMKNDLFLKDIV